MFAAVDRLALLDIRARPEGLFQHFDRLAQGKYGFLQSSDALLDPLNNINRGEIEMGLDLQPRG
jgi:hypothetical protein